MISQTNIFYSKFYKQIYQQKLYQRIYYTMKNLNVNQNNPSVNNIKPLNSSTIKELNAKTAEKSFFTTITNKINSGQYSSYDNKMEFEEYIKLQYEQLMMETQSLKNKNEMFESSVRFLNEKINLKDRQILRLIDQAKERQKIIMELTKKYKNLKNNFKQLEQFRTEELKIKSNNRFQEYSQVKKSVEEKIQTKKIQTINHEKEIVALQQQIQNNKIELMKYATKQKIAQEKIQELNRSICQKCKDLENFQSHCKNLQKERFEYFKILDQKNNKIENYINQMQQLKIKLNNISKQYQIQSDKIKNYANQIIQIQKQHNLEKASLETQIKFLREKPNVVNQHAYSEVSNSDYKFQIQQSMHSDSDSLRTSPKKQLNKKKVMTNNKENRNVLQTTYKYRTNNNSPNNSEVDRKIGGIKTYKANNQNKEVNKLLNRYYKIKNRKE